MFEETNFEIENTNIENLELRATVRRSKTAHRFRDFLPNDRDCTATAPQSSPSKPPGEPLTVRATDTSEATSRSRNHRSFSYPVFFYTIIASEKTLISLIETHVPVENRSLIDKKIVFVVLHFNQRLHMYCIYRQRADDMTTTSAPSSRPLPRIRGPLSIADWISRGCAESDAPAFPMSLYLIDCECVAGLDRLTLVAARLRLMIYALAYESGVAERGLDGAVTGRVCVSVPVACLTSFTGLKRGRVIEALERLQGASWRFGGFGMTRIKSAHTGSFAASLETTSSVIEVIFDAVVSMHLMRPHGWTHVCLGRVHDASSIHAVGLLPVASYWLSVASRWQPRRETPRGDGANIGMRYSEFRQFHLSHAQLLGLALARPDMHQRDVNRHVIAGVLAGFCDAIEITRHPVLKNGGYDVIVSAPKKSDTIRQNPAVTGNIARYTVADIPALKLRPHDVIAALQRLGWMAYEEQARTLLRIWSVYAYRLGDRVTAADFQEMIDLIAGGAEIEITRDDIIAADQARRGRIKSLPETVDVAAPVAGARAWPVSEINALHSADAQELETDDDGEPVDFALDHIIDDGIPF